jgi:preprotein translocase subunit SecA
MRVRRELAGIDDPAERERRVAAMKEEVARLKAKALAAGGLYVIGTERHESRRIDNQLRGRSGRQGDPGRSKFYLSLQDDLMRIFGTDRMDNVLQKLGLKEGEAVAHPWVNKALETAQKKVEARNFDIRKNILKYDDVMNDQRKAIFSQRREFMAQESVQETIDSMRHSVIDESVSRHIPEGAYAEAWDTAGLKEDVEAHLNLDLPVADWAKEEGIADEEIRERLTKAADEMYAARTQTNTPEMQRYIEKQVLLQSLDGLWREHLVTLDHLRNVIGWRGYAQRDPLNEFKSEAFQLFQDMTARLRQNVTGQLMRVEVVFQRPEEESLPQPGLAAVASAGYGAGLMPVAEGFGAGDDGASTRDPNDPSTWGKVGRNEACPCGSGKKYKHCHGAFA